MNQQSLNRLSNQKPKVVIVGAGISGIAAASELHSKGFDVLVLEGRSRIGGRIYTDTSLGAPVDLGASWIHGKVGNPIYELATKMHLKTCRNFGRMELFGPEGKPPLHSDIVIARNIMNEVFSIINQNREFSVDMSLHEAFDNAYRNLPLFQFDEDGSTMKEELRSNGSSIKAVLDFFLTGMEQYYGASFHNLSCKYYDLEDECPGGDVILPDGYMCVLQKILNGFEIKLGHIVKEINYQETYNESKNVSIVTNCGVFEGDYCIVTIPLGVLKKGDIKFNPPLPCEKQNAIDRLGFGLMNKVVLRFKERFWSADVGSIGYASASRGEFRWYYSLEKAVGLPILVAFTSAQFGEELEKEDEHTIFQRAMRVLRKCYPHIEDPIGWIVTKWKSDPFAYGSYSYYKVGSTPQDYDILAEPVRNILFFAGEATNRKFPGTVHGAYLSGKREAERIVKIWKQRHRMPYSRENNNNNNNNK